MHTVPIQHFASNYQMDNNLSGDILCRLFKRIEKIADPGRDWMQAVGTSAATEDIFLKVSSKT